MKTKQQLKEQLDILSTWSIGSLAEARAYIWKLQEIVAALVNNLPS
jgi:hypothetical protein